MISSPKGHYLIEELEHDYFKLCIRIANPFSAYATEKVSEKIDYRINALGKLALAKLNKQLRWQQLQKQQAIQRALK